MRERNVYTDLYIFLLLLFVLAITILLIVKILDAQNVPLLPNPPEGYEWDIQRIMIPPDSTVYLPYLRETWWHAHSDKLKYIVTSVSSLLAMGIGGGLWKFVKRKKS